MQRTRAQLYQFNSSRWIKIALFNFLIVALAGIVLRYKINFSLPLINQKYLLQGHSHFALVGWVSLALMTLMIAYLIKHRLVTNYKKYQNLLVANTISAYGMLFTFILQGYALFSITFSTLSIFVSYFFIYYYWKDLKRLQEAQYIKIWFKSALLLLGISSIGPFGLAYLMANHSHVQEWYISAIYFFLHFQYNGWFLFACMGLLFSFLKTKNVLSFLKINRQLFFILALTVGPSYLLSLLGLKLPSYLYWVAVIAAVFQLVMLFFNHQLMLLIRNNITLTKMGGYLWSLVYVSFGLKIILQGLSVLPFLNEFAFTMRGVIIGYLHLSFLGIFSFFILGYFVEFLANYDIELSKYGLLIFGFGVILQEVILMGQALDAIVFKSPSNTHIVLFVAAVIMAMGIGKILLSKKL